MGTGKVTGATEHPGAYDAVPPRRGFHHVAFATPDLDETVRFYGGVLGMRTSEVFPATGQQDRHCFVRPGYAETYGLHFFEQPDARVFSLPGDVRAVRLRTRRVAARRLRSAGRGVRP